MLDYNLVVFKERKIGLGAVTVCSQDYDLGWWISEIQAIHSVVTVMKLEPAGEKKTEG